MQPEFQFVRQDGASIVVSHPTGGVYASVTVNQDFSVTAVKVSQNQVDQLDALTERALTGLFKFVGRRHANHATLTPEQLVGEFLAGARNTGNRARWPRRGEK